MGIFFWIRVLLLIIVVRFMKEFNNVLVSTDNLLSKEYFIISKIIDGFLSVAMLSIVIILLINLDMTNEVILLGVAAFGALRIDYVNEKVKDIILTGCDYLSNF